MADRNHELFSGDFYIDQGLPDSTQTDTYSSTEYMYEFIELFVGESIPSTKTHMVGSVNVVVYADLITGGDRGRYLRILSPDLQEITKMYNSYNTLIYEVINADYVFSFNTIMGKDVAHINGDNIIEVNNDYFIVSKVKKERSGSQSISVETEHISYRLNKKEDYQEDYDTDARGMLEGVTKDTEFEIDIVDFNLGDVRYYKPEDKSVRKRLIDIANLFGGELLYNKFKISLLAKREGTIRKYGLTLGKNIMNVSEEIDYADGGRRVYEVDALDMSYLPNYEYLNSINLGDTVDVIDPELAISTEERIVSHEIDPFQKAKPTIEIGNVARDYTGYEREVEEKEEKELNISDFEIGGVNCLSLYGVDVTQQEKTKLKDGTPYEPTATIDYNELLEFKGLFTRASSEEFGIVVTIKNNSGIQTFYRDDLEDLKELEFPMDVNTTVEVTVARGSVGNLDSQSDFKMLTVRFIESEDSNDGILSGNVWTEWATVPFEGLVNIMFSQRYRAIPSVNVRMYGADSPLHVELITSNESEGNTIYDGITVTGSATGELTMHAIGRV